MRNCYRCYVPPYNTPRAFPGIPDVSVIPDVNVTLSGNNLSKTVVNNIINSEKFFINSGKLFIDNETPKPNTEGVSICGITSVGFPISGITFLVTNTSDTVAHDVTMELPVPNGCNIISCTFSQGSVSRGDKLLWNINSLDANSSARIEIICNAGSVWTATITTSTPNVKLQNESYTVLIPC